MISILNSTVFRGLKSLQSLNLYHNLLSALPRDIFSDLFKLVYLDISANHLFYIPSQTLSTLYSLQNLYLSYMSSAFDTVVSDLNSLTNLKVLNIVGLNTNVTNATVQPLTGLPIQDFKLVWLPIPTKYCMDKTAFAPFTSIQKLITDFIALPALESLHSPLQTLTLVSYTERFPYVLHNTTLQVLSKVNKALSSLTLAFPNLYQIDNDAFIWMPNLTYLSLWGSKLQKIAPSSFRGLRGLNTLDLYDNQMTAVPTDALNVIGKHSSLQHLYLNENSISTIADDTFSGVSSIMYLNLGNNNFQDVVVHTRWLYMLPNLKHLVLGVSDMSSAILTIGLPMPLISLHTFEIQNVEMVQFETNLCLTFPNLRYVVLSNAIISNFPFSLSLYACSSLIELDLSGSIENINSPHLKDTTINIPTLEDLSSARNKLKSITQILFIKAPILISLNLSDNQIKSIDSVIAQAFKHLSHLSIDDNALVSLSGLEDLNNLEHLSAARNQITQVPLWLISKSQKPILVTLDLRANPFHCSCEIEQFRKWIASDTNTWLQPGQYSCATPETLAGVSISDVELDCRSYTGFYIGISIPFVVLFCMITVFLIRYKWHIKYKLFLLFRNYQTFPDQNQNFEMLQLQYQYHAYISYNETSTDKDWVLNSLQPNMEEGLEPVKLCIKSRDFIPGHSLLESISENIHQSRKTVLVLSPNFVDSNWCYHEMEMAKMRFLDENLDVIILVLLHNIPDNMMTLSLRQLLCKKEYLKWPKDRVGQRLFWQKPKTRAQSTQSYRPSLLHVRR